MFPPSQSETGWEDETLGRRLIHFKLILVGMRRGRGRRVGRVGGFEEVA